jgi:hypothetical protein
MFSLPSARNGIVEVSGLTPNLAWEWEPSDWGKSIDNAALFGAFGSQGGQTAAVHAFRGQRGASKERMVTTVPRSRQCYISEFCHKPGSPMPQFRARAAAPVCALSPRRTARLRLTCDSHIQCTTGFEYQLSARLTTRRTRCRGDPVASAPLDVDVSACPCCVRHAAGCEVQRKL